MANASYLKKFDPIQEAPKYSYGIRTGVRTAGNFTITLGFKPIKIRVVNLEDRVEAVHYVDPAPIPAPATTTYGLDAGANAKSLVTVAAGTRTYAAAGIALTSDGLGFTVTVATAGLETSNDDCLWEAWG
jgi:hypothetical protein